MTQNIPGPGMGTWQLEGSQCEKSVKTAIDVGYRHIDTAQMYKNEEQVGNGISASDVPREDLFVATKLWHDSLTAGKVRSTTGTSLKRLNLERIDLLYIHWPSGEYTPEETLPALQEIREEGLIRHIGLSNFTPEQVEEAIEVLGEPPLAHQVEMHPHLQQRELRKLAVEHDMALVAYSPLKRTEVLDEDVLQDIATEHSASPAQVCLAWHMSKENVVPIPKATGEEHLRDNFAARDLTLTDEQIRRIDALDAGDRSIDPPFAPW